MTTATVARPLVVLALVGSLAGCVIHERAADVTLYWDAAACPAAYLDIELADLDDGSVDVIEGVPCATGGVGVQDLDPGPYVVTVSGGGFVIYQADVRLRGGDNEVPIPF